MSGNHRLTGDIGSGAVVALGWMAAFNSWLPEFVTILSAIGTIMGICWYAVQFYNWLRGRP